MIKSCFLIFVFVCITGRSAIGQVTFNYYTDRFVPIEEPDDVNSSAIKTTTDGGYVAFTSNHYASSLSIIKFDSTGGLTWSYDFNGGTGCAGIQLNDGGYAAVGGDGNILVVRTDASGNQLWAKTYSTGINGNWIQQTLDGGLIIGGYGQNYPFDDAVLIKTDINGNVKWSKECALNGNHVENLSGIQLKDSTYVFGGGIGYVSPNGIVLIKTDKNGNMLWNKVYQFAGQSYSFSMRQTRDNGFIMVGTDNNPVWHVIKSDSAGNIQWSKRIYPNISNPYGYCMDVEQLDYGYALAGWYYNSVGYCSSYLVKIDPTGNMLWNGTYHDQFWTGLFSVKQTPDKGLVSYGYAQNSYQWGDFVKTDSNGQGACFVPIDMVDTNFTFTVTSAGLTVSSPVNTVTNVTGPWSGAAATATFTCSSAAIAAQFSANKISVCSGDSVTFSDRSTGSPTSWNWTFTGGTPDTSSAQNPTVVYNIPGTYNVELVVKSSGGTDSLTKNSYITVSPLPVPGTITGPGAICEGDSAILSDTGSTGTIQWQSSLNGTSFANIPDDTSSVNNISGLTQTTYYRVNATGTCGTDSSAIFRLVANPLPVPVVTTVDSLICSGDSTQVCTADTFTTYLWNTGNASFCTNAEAAGGYWVTVTDANQCSAISGHQEVSVYAVPSVSIIVQGDTLSSFGQINYQWILNGNPLNGDTNAVFIAKQAGLYSVQVTDSNGCTATSNAVTVTSVKDLAEAGVSIYPNPSFSSWQLVVNNELIGSSLEIFDDNGQLVFQSTIRNLQSAINLNLAKGVYWLRVSSPSASIVKKIIKL